MGGSEETHRRTLVDFSAEAPTACFGGGGGG